MGCSVEVAEREDGVYLTIRREGTALASTPVAPPLTCAAAPPPPPATVVFVPSDCLGRGPAELGERLMGAFFHTLVEAGPTPKMVIFINTGVKLTVEGSRALDDLRALAQRGVEILACGTCLGYFGLTDKLAVGRVSNMYDIATALFEAGKLVAL